MKIKHNARATLLGIVIAAAAAPGAFASSDIIKVMTDPCATMMNTPVRAIRYQPAPPSERGLQCPIHDDFTSPWND